MDNDKIDHFSAKIEIIGINPFVYVPDHILKSLFVQAKKDKGYIPIKGTVNGNPYRQTLLKYSGAWRLYINTIMLKDSPKRIGETIEVSVSMDTESRDVPIPLEFEKALRANEEANLAFDKLTASRKKEMVRYLANIKTQESLDRNIAKAINFLNGNEAFLGRTNP